MINFYGLFSLFLYISMYAYSFLGQKFQELKTLTDSGDDDAIKEQINTIVPKLTANFLPFLTALQGVVASVIIGSANSKTDIKEFCETFFTAEQKIEEKTDGFLGFGKIFKKKEKESQPIKTDEDKPQL